MFMSQSATSSVGVKVLCELRTVPQVPLIHQQLFEPIRRCQKDRPPLPTWQMSVSQALNGQQPVAPDVEMISEAYLVRSKLDPTLWQHLDYVQAIASPQAAHAASRPDAAACANKASASHCCCPHEIAFPGILECGGIVRCSRDQIYLQSIEWCCGCPGRQAGGASC